MKQQYFANDGLLSSAIDGFSPRPQQQEMATAVAAAIETSGSLLVEAGTGTGKTFAYLVPAMDSGKKVVISTGSKALQDQLFTKDLPKMQKALKYTQSVALLKGRSNYLCIERLNSFSHYSSGQDRNTLAELVKIKRWAQGEDTGDISDLGPVAERSDVFPLISSTNDNCLGRDCPSYKECYLVKARNKALEADLVVVNHHLFFADMVVKETGFGELIPEAHAYIFDEAHQLPDIAASYFGQHFSSRQIVDLCSDIELCYKTDLRDMAQLQKAAQKLERGIRQCRLAFEGLRDRGEWRPLAKQHRFAEMMAVLKEDMDFVYQVLKLALSRSELADSCFERLARMRGLFDKVMAVDTTGFSYWYETTRLHFTLNITPLNIAERFNNEVEERDAAWIFTSATLAVDGNFQHFQTQMGLNDASSMLLDSPFDYQKQALLCVPRYLPETKQHNAEQLMLDQLAPVIEANGGRCFFLCTSHRMIQKVAAELRLRTELLVLVQGEAGKQELLNEFVEDGNAVLVATSTFWEGVDVPGKALSCVIIDKLPFAAPDDPLLKAKSEDCRLRGGDPFRQVYLPQAVISLKQGVGRLIRTQADHGVVIICDNRLVNRDYGSLFISSLPAMPRTRELSKVLEFVKNNAEES
ncbi:ATP-dependent DNA helicase [Agarivorans sp. TSD2052]|uniref:ATP-dependent DNA helicase n=1 Tax=Agarivorans sp. TSD2052 TaxID=2937286 RepID=UPI00200CCE33|nr:ATP-dependent DNA helicase [Agarivorans sp. TSD2052]UPW16871.1 ATP-dependent DNA helicase [Agarivorans sp. TSD2052]